MREWVAVALLSGIGLAGCSKGERQYNSVDLNAAATRAQGDIDNYVAGNAVADAPPVANAAVPAGADRSPNLAAPGDQGTPAAAAAVVTRYFAAIAGGRYGAAWRMWRQDGQASGMTEAAFGESFARYATYVADVGTPRDEDHGAGQVYITVPVRVTGTLKAGGAFAMEGPVVLHRANDGIETDDPRDHLWQIQSSELKPRPGG